MAEEFKFGDIVYDAQGLKAVVVGSVEGFRPLVAYEDDAQTYDVSPEYISHTRPLHKVQIMRERKVWGEEGYGIWNEGPLPEVDAHTKIIHGTVTYEAEA